MTTLRTRLLFATLVGGCHGAGGGLLLAASVATGEYVTDEDFFGLDPGFVCLSLPVVTAVVLGMVAGMGYAVFAGVRGLIVHRPPHPGDQL